MYKNKLKNITVTELGYHQICDIIHYNLLDSSENYCIRMHYWAKSKVKPNVACRDYVLFNLVQ